MAKKIFRIVMSNFMAFACIFLLFSKSVDASSEKLLVIHQQNKIVTKNLDYRVYNVTPYLNKELRQNSAKYIKRGRLQKQELAASLLLRVKRLNSDQLEFYKEVTSKQTSPTERQAKIWLPIKPENQAFYILEKGADEAVRTQPMIVITTKGDSSERIDAYAKSEIAETGSKGRKKGKAPRVTYHKLYQTGVDKQNSNLLAFLKDTWQALVAKFFWLK